MHHPPFQTLIGHMDKISLVYGGNRLHDLVKDNAQVKRVICGHLHRAIDMGFAGAIASTTLSVLHIKLYLIFHLMRLHAGIWNRQLTRFMFIKPMQKFYLILPMLMTMKGRILSMKVGN